MRYQIYSRTNQKIIDAVIVGVSFCLAYQIRYEGQVPPYQSLQFWTLLVPMISGRLLTNSLLGADKIRWRHISILDALRIVESYLTFSILLVLARYGLPVRWGLGRIPIGVIAIEFLLSLQCALGVRMLRRFLYERQANREDRQTPDRPRRLLLVGAGMMGANVAKEMAFCSSIQVTGFLDDDPLKIGSVVAGARVLGPTSMLAETVREQKVDDVLICIAPEARRSFNRLVALLEGLPVTSKFVPTIREILDSKDGLHLGIEAATAHEGAQGVRVIPREEKPAVHSNVIRNKNILITGGAGFIGSTLAERLAAHNQVVLLDRLFRDQPVGFTALQSNPNIRMVEEDILEGHAVGPLAQEADIVIHAAAIVGVGRVCSYPRETLETNFSGTSRILRALERNSRLERFIYFSTSEVFGVNSFRVQEDAPSAVGPAAEARWSYAIAKLAGEHLVKSYHRQSRMPVVTVRPFNIFGPRRLGSHAIMSFILNALTGNPIEVHGDGSQIRSWCYISDFCDALIEMITRPAAVGEDFNIGNPTNTLTIFQLAQQVIGLTGSSAPVIFTEHGFPDIGIRVPSLAKAKEILGFLPTYDLKSGLALTIDWYREHLSFFESRMARAATKA